MFLSLRTKGKAWVLGTQAFFVSATARSRPEPCSGMKHVRIWDTTLYMPHPRPVSGEKHPPFGAVPTAVWRLHPV